MPDPKKRQRRHAFLEFASFPVKKFLWPVDFVHDEYVFTVHAEVAKNWSTIWQDFKSVDLETLDIVKKFSTEEETLL